MKYDYTDSSGKKFYECECGVTYSKVSFNDGRCPECNHDSSEVGNIEIYSRSRDEWLTND